MAFDFWYEHLLEEREPTNRELILEIKPAIWTLIGIVLFFFERFPHPDK